MENTIAALLELQKQDLHCLDLENRLKTLPSELTHLEQKIAQLKIGVEAQKKALQAKEIQRREIDNALLSCEERLLRYKTQQLSAKKNEEYQALEHQILVVRQEVEALEEKGIQLLIEVDKDSAALSQEEAQVKEKCLIIQEEIGHLLGRKETLLLQAEKAREAYELQRQGLDADLRSRYDFVKKRVRRAPFVVSLKNHHCQGCFLKLSQECESLVISNNLADCEQCGRILYLSL